MEQYVKESREEGIGIGREEGIAGSVAMLRSLSIPDERIVGMIMQQYSLSIEEAAEYVKQQP